MPVWGITGENNLQWSYHSPWLQIKCPICENKMTEMISKLLNEMDNWGSGWQSKGKSVTAVPTSLEIPSLHHNIPDQATKHVLRRQTSAGRGEDSVFTSVMLGAYMQSQWITVFIWCRTFNVKMPTILSSVSCCLLFTFTLTWIKKLYFWTLTVTRAQPNYTPNTYGRMLFITPVLAHLIRRELWLVRLGCLCFLMCFFFFFLICIKFSWNLLVVVFLPAFFFFLVGFRDMF